MKLKKITTLLFTILFITIILCSSFTKVVKAADVSYNLNLKFIRNLGYGYQFGANSGATAKKVWKIYNTNGSGETFYCLKGGPGFGSDDYAVGTPKQTTYTKAFDMRKPEDIPEYYSSKILDYKGENYASLMWILDHCYVPAKNNASDEENQKAAENKKILIEAAKQYAIKEGIDEVGHDGGAFDKLNDDDIDAVQQLTIWYFTNEDGNPYHVKNINFWLNAIANSENGSFMQLDGEKGGRQDYFTDGTARAHACEALFEYFKENAKKNSDYNYKAISSSKPVELTDTNAKVQKSGERYIVGPYHLTQLKNIEYTLNAIVTDGNGVMVPDVQYLNSNNGAPGSTTANNLKDLLEKDFYISVQSTTDVSQIKLKIEGYFYNTKITYLSVENPTNTDQPVVMVEKEKVPFTDEVIAITGEYELELEKVDGYNSNTKLSNVQFEVTLPDNTQQTLTTDTQGKINLSNLLIAEEGTQTITLKETTVPTGYSNQNITITLTVTTKLINGQYVVQDVQTNSVKGVTLNHEGNKISLTVKNYQLDLALRKFIIQIADKKLQNADGSYIREPHISPEEIGKLENGSTTTADKIHPKNPLAVHTGDHVIYIIRVYNEGQIAGIAKKVTDYLPVGLEFVEGSTINQYYGWSNPNGDKKTIETTHLENHVLRAFDGTELDYADLQIECKVVAEPGATSKELKNVAEITKHSDEHGDETVKDRDSQPGNVNVPNYEDHSQQDDDDFERLILSNATGEYSIELEKIDGYNNAIKLPGAEFEATLPDGSKQKLVTDQAGKLQINNIVITEVGTQTITLTETKAPEGYSNSKANIVVTITTALNNENYVVQNVQINSEVTGVNVKHEGNKISLTMENYQLDLALRKFIIQIADKELKDENGNYTREPQISTEEIGKLESGSTTTANKVHPKNTLTVKTGDRVIYVIRVYNEGAIAGYAKKVTDYLPVGLRFVEDSKINQEYGWSNPSGDGRTIETEHLKDDLIQAFDGDTLHYRDLQIECEVIAEQGATSQELRNIAEITKHSDKNGDETVKDRDSNPNNVDKDHYEDKSQQDDDDFEKLEVLPKQKDFDLSLRKFITTIEKGANKKTYDRAPEVDVTELANGNSTTATYNHPKDPIGVVKGDIVTYTIRVYNEGEVDGYVNEITDHLPPQLEFLQNDELNEMYGWVLEDDGRTVKTDITSANTQNSNRDAIYEERTTNPDKVLLKAFDGQNLDFIDVQIKCKVKDNAVFNEKITNIAEISNFEDENHDVVTDRDSQEDNCNIPSDNELPNYKDPEIESGDSYIPGQQDDDDFEKLIVQKFDLALRKFITGVNDEAITNRAPVFHKDSDTEFHYEHPKDPVDVVTGNIVTYTLRIFNEGNISGYAKEVMDDLPDGLEFLPDNQTNIDYRWVMYTANGEVTKNVQEAEYIKTDYLSKEQEKEEGQNLLKAFDQENMTMPDYRDIKIAFKVVEPNTSDQIIINTAEITNDSDENGNDIDDEDSTPNNNNEKEDDLDKEKVKLKYFDLSLKKWVTESIVTYGGKTTVTKTGHTGDENPEPPAKVEVRGSRLAKTTIKFKFKIKVTNEGDIEGYAKEITDYIPDGYAFDPADNPLWKEKDGVVVTDQLKDKLLKPGQSATVEIIFTWINNKNNLGERVNWAEISKDENKYNVPDKDSTPGNNNKNEDDIDKAPVIISITTGAAQTYVTIVLASISILAGGIVLIKKFVI